MSLCFEIPDGCSGSAVKTTGGWRISIWQNSSAPMGQYAQPLTEGQYVQPLGQYEQPTLCESGWYGGLDAPQESIEAEREEVEGNSENEVPLRRSQSSPPTIGCYSDEVSLSTKNEGEPEVEREPEAEKPEAETEEEKPEEEKPEAEDDPWSNDIDEEYIRKLEKEEEENEEEEEEEKNLEELIIVQNPNLCNVEDYVRFVYTIKTHKGFKVVTFVYLRKGQQVMVTLPHSELKNGMMLDGTKYRVRPEYQKLSFAGFIETPIFSGI